MSTETKLETLIDHSAKGVVVHRPCSEPLYVLEQRFNPGWYLEWWGDGEGGPYWTNDLAKAEKLTMKRALYEQGMLREVTLIVPNDQDQTREPKTSI